MICRGCDGVGKNYHRAFPIRDSRWYKCVVCNGKGDIADEEHTTTKKQLQAELDSVCKELELERKKNKEQLVVKTIETKKPEIEELITRWSLLEID